MKINLITGATGFVGKYLAEALLKKGENVWVLVRSLEGVSAEQRSKDFFRDFIEKWPGTFRVISGDVIEDGLGVSRGVKTEMKGNEIVFWHLAANLSFSAANKAEVQKTNFIGTENTVKFANQYANRFVHMSTAYVCGDSPTFKEGDLEKGQKFRNHYERSKFKAEKFVHDNCKLPYRVFRPSIIIGDAYQGKAEGCTFGYYRYTFMFYFLKKNIVKTLEKNGFWSRVLKFLGTSYDAKNKILSTPWLMVPFPRNGLVDMISVDYVIESMVALYDKDIDSSVVHLTHNEAPKHKFILHSILHDVGFRDFKLISIPPRLFVALARIIYFVVVPIRKYVKSVMWYIPYITTKCEFGRSVVTKHYKNPPLVSREVIRRINEYAKENILENIEV